MSTLSNILKRIGNALSYDNVGNLGELKRKLEEDLDGNVPAVRPALRLVVSRRPAPQPAATPLLHAAAR